MMLLLLCVRSASAAVFFAGGQAAANVPLFFIDIQDFACLAGERRVDLTETFCDVLMYSRLGNTEFPGGLPYGCIGFNDIGSYFNGTFFDIFFQGWAPGMAVFTVYAAAFRLMYRSEEHPCAPYSIVFGGGAGKSGGLFYNT